MMHIDTLLMDLVIRFMLINQLQVLCEYCVYENLVLVTITH